MLSWISFERSVFKVGRNGGKIYLCPQRKISRSGTGPASCSIATAEDLSVSIYS